jgi:hypothetical protein
MTTATTRTKQRNLSRLMCVTATRYLVAVPVENDVDLLALSFACDALFEPLGR